MVTINIPEWLVYVMAFFFLTTALEQVFIAMAKYRFTRMEKEIKESFEKHLKERK